jgi:hypothetical protein
MLQAHYRRVNKTLIILFIFVSAVVTAEGQSQKPSPTPSPLPNVHRWFDLDALSIAIRYRYINAANGATVGNAQQWQMVARGRFKFDRKGKYGVVAHMQSGNTFTGGWDNTGFGTGDSQTNLFLKQLYFDAKPTRTIEIQFGGLAITNGENTEITGYDNDNFIVGERASFRVPKTLYFDEITITNAFLGDINRPSVFRRFKRLDRSNYHQLLVRKQVTKNVGFSADYTFDSGVDTLRQAVRVKLPKAKIVDSVLYENYERIDPQPGYGFAVTVEKKVSAKLNLSGGFAKISNVMLNSDRFPRGERIFLSAAYKPIAELTINPVLIRAVGPLATSNIPRTRFEIIASYNILEALHHYRVF